MITLWTGVTNAFWNAVDKAGLSVKEKTLDGKMKLVRRFRSHDLRHTFGPRLEMGRIDTKRIPMNQNFEDHYEDLQISLNADQETIERVYRLLAKRYHPDNSGSGSRKSSISSPRPTRH